jgi:hypothetical protein
MANTITLILMNTQITNRNIYSVQNLMNGIFTYMMGYVYFLDKRTSSGVYMFLLGFLSMFVAVEHDLSSILSDWNTRFRIPPPLELKKVDESSEDESAEEESADEQDSEDDQVLPEPEPETQTQTTSSTDLSETQSASSTDVSEPMTGHPKEE